MENGNEEDKDKRETGTLHGSRAAIFTELDARRNLWVGHVWIEGVGEQWADKFSDRTQARDKALDWFRNSQYSHLTYSLEGEQQNHGRH